MIDRLTIVLAQLNQSVGDLRGNSDAMLAVRAAHPAAEEEAGHRPDVRGIGGGIGVVSGCVWCAVRRYGGYCVCSVAC